MWWEADEKIQSWEKCVKGLDLELTETQTAAWGDEANPRVMRLESCVLGQLLH